MRQDVGAALEGTAARVIAVDVFGRGGVLEGTLWDRTGSGADDGQWGVHVATLEAATREDVVNAVEAAGYRVTGWWAEYSIGGLSGWLLTAERPGGQD